VNALVMVVSMVHSLGSPLAFFGTNPRIGTLLPVAGHPATVPSDRQLVLLLLATWPI